MIATTLIDLPGALAEAAPEGPVMILLRAGAARGGGGGRAEGGALMARKFQPQMATGNDLLEGDVVYFTSDGEWSREIGDAALAVNPEAADGPAARGPRRSRTRWSASIWSRRRSTTAAARRRRISARCSAPAGPPTIPSTAGRRSAADV